MTVPEPTKDAMAAAVGATHTAGDLLERLAARVGGRAAVTAVFGEPVTAGGVTVIPVATAVFGLGGGAGEDAGGAKGAGSGGGGGAIARPRGYIEIAGGTSVFKPIRDPRAEALLSLAVVLAAGATVRAAVALGRRRRR